MPNQIEKIGKARCAAAIAGSQASNERLVVLDVKNDAAMESARAKVTHNTAMIEASDELNRKIEFTLSCH